VVNEMLQKVREIRRCASNCIKLDGAASKCSNGGSLTGWAICNLVWFDRSVGERPHFGLRESW